MPQQFARLAAMDREQVAAAAAGAVLVLPIGATEQHGPSLPLATDFALVTHVAELGCARADAPVVLAPTLPYGNSVHHLFACAGSMSAATLQRVLADLVDSFVASGFRRVVIANGHGGNDECAKLAVKDAVNRHDLVAAAVNYWSLVPKDVPCDYDVPGHAGAFEASLLLAARPDLLPAVRPSRPGPPALHTRDFGHDVVVVRSGDWPASGGFTDDPAAADAEVGRALVDGIADAFARLLERIAAEPARLLPATGQE